MSTRDRSDRFSSYAIRYVRTLFLGFLALFSTSLPPSHSLSLSLSSCSCSFLFLVAADVEQAGRQAASGAGLSVRQGVKLLMPDRASREDEREERWRGKDGSRDFRKSFPCHSAPDRFFISPSSSPRYASSLFSSTEAVADREPVQASRAL